MFKHKSRGSSLALITALSLLLAACGSDPTPTPVSSGGEISATTPAPGTLTGTITFQVFGDPPELATFESIVEEFKKVEPNATVEIIWVPDQGDHMTKLTTSFAAGTPPDVFNVNYRRFGQFASTGVIQPVQPFMERDGIGQDLFYEQAVDAFKFKGVLECSPRSISSLVVYYNEDLFAKYKVAAPTEGWTWDDFLEAAKALTVDENGDGVTDIYGVGIEPTIIRLPPFVWQNDGDIVDNNEKPTTLTLSTGKPRDAVQFFMDLQLVHHVVPSEKEMTSEDDESRFMRGKLGMILSSRVSTPSFRTIEDFKWNVGPLPQEKEQASILHSGGYCIANATKNKELSWAFVKFANGPEGQTISAELGRDVPSLKSVANSPVFLEPSLPPTNSKVFLDIIPFLKRTPTLSTWSEIENITNAELEQAFYGKKPIDQALDKATEATKPLFAEGNADNEK